MLVAKARAWIEGEERTPGLHASDFLDTRMAYWQRHIPKGISDKLVNIFLVGKVLHAIVLGGVGGSIDVHASDSGSLHSDILGISYSPDAVLDGIVRELKTSRSPFEPRDIKDLEMYLEQLLVYMVATETTTSQLWILYLNLRDETNRTSPGFRCYDFTISEQDLELTKRFLLENKAQLEKALETGDPSELPLCRRFKCGEKNCQWWENCKPEGRYGISPKKWEV
jgi:hypothetical protein